MNTYLLLYGPEVPSKKVTDFANQLPEVLNWMVDRTIFPNGILIVSKLDANQLAGRFRKLLGDSNRLVVNLTQASSQGWLPEAVWDFINKPQSVDSSDDDDDLFS